MVLLVSLPGCKGCLGFDPVAEREKKKKEAEEEAEKKKKKPKPDYEVLSLEVVTRDADVLQNLIKPGHWVSATQVMRANNFDVSADLESATVSQQGDPIELEHAPFGLRMARPVSLPKGQAKAPEVFCYIPRRVGLTSKAPWLETKLRTRSGGREVATTMKPTIPMPNYQYYFMVLAREPDRYGYLKAPYMGSIKVPCDSFDEDSLLMYRVVLPKIDKLAPVPSHPLTWTTVAYVIWDDLDASVLSPDQQQSMVDWLHWGGQLIVSGPNSLNRLRRSFLADYLPADEVKAVDLTGDDFKELNDNFTLEIVSDKDRPKTPLEAPEGKAIVGVELELKPGAEFVPKTGRLLAERQVGQGRIVVTGFPLTDRNVVNWPSYDNFFNACILRRPARVYTKGENEILALHWRDYRNLVRDPRLVTSLRYFSRDIDHPAGKAAQQNEQRERELERESTQAVAGAGSMMIPGLVPDYSEGYSQPIHFIGMHPDTDDYHFGGYLGRTQSGVAGWSDFSGAAHLARTSLQEAAGIDVPESSFVLKVMAVYLLVLVPVNWGFFRILGRVEWAWIAAPIIAIVGAVAVVKMAQLDIGFARSRTEIAVLETHGGYHRGHLTRYTALYTSLSSNYTLAFEESSALAAPFAVDPNYTRLRHQDVSTVYFERGRDVRLRGFPVQSNSTNMVHSEQMYNLGDGIKLAGDDGSILKVFNGSELPVQGVGVYRRNDAGRVEGAWIGELPPKTAKTLNFQVMGDFPQRFDQWNDSPTTSTQPPRGEVSLSRLIDLSVERLRLRQGDVRLVGWTDTDPKGLDIRPAASQEVFRTLVVSHLERAPLSEPQSDTNHYKDVIAQGARPPLTDADFTDEGADPAKVLEP
jgi:hypothetical protein